VQSTSDQNRFLHDTAAQMMLVVSVMVLRSMFFSLYWAIDLSNSA